MDDRQAWLSVWAAGPDRPRICGGGLRRLTFAVLRGEPIRTLESCHVKYVPKPLPLKIVRSGREHRRRGLENRRGAILRALESRVDRVEVVPRPASRTNRDRSCRTCRSPWWKHIALNSTIPVSSAVVRATVCRRSAARASAGSASGPVRPTSSRGARKPSATPASPPRSVSGLRRMRPDQYMTRRIDEHSHGARRR